MRDSKSRLNLENLFMPIPALEIYTQLVVFINLVFVLVALFYLWKNRKALFNPGTKSLQAKEKSAEIIQEAVRKANDIVVAAELQGVESVASHKLSSKKLEALYEEEIAGFLEGLRERFAALVQDIEAGLESSQDQYNSTLAKFSSDLEKAKTVQTDVFKGELNNILEQFRSDLHIIPQEINTSLLEYINYEKNKVKESLQDYEERRKRYIDEHAAMLLEDLMRLTLGKALTLDQHADIVEQSLKIAQEEGFFGDA